jgi:hypothetical protein
MKKPSQETGSDIIVQANLNHNFLSAPTFTANLPFWLLFALGDSGRGLDRKGERDAGEAHDKAFHCR